jgi:DNA-binding MarR family transcriptional regulator
MAQDPDSTARSTLVRAVARLEHDPADCVFRSVSRLARVVAATFDEGLTPAGLTASQFNLLMTLMRLGPMPVGGFAERLSMDASNVPRVLAPLLKARLVTIRPGADRRVRVVEITAAGCNKLRLALPHWQRLQRRLLQALGEPSWTPLRKSLTGLRHSTQAARARRH